MVAEHSDGARLAEVIATEVEAVLAAISGTDIQEILLDDGDVSIAIVRGGASPLPVLVSGDLAGPVASSVLEDDPMVAATVRAPAVGFFHRARTEGGVLLAVDNAKVADGGAIGVIETLGMAGDVLSPIAGVIAFTIADGHAVAYGDPIAIVRPA